MPTSRHVLLHLLANGLPLLQLIPMLVDLYHQGRFPIDRISKCYPALSLDQAIADLKNGHVSTSSLRVVGSHQPPHFNVTLMLKF